MMNTTQQYQVLDPRTMGRPVHLLGKFAERIREDLSDVFNVRMNQRYRASFEIGDASFRAKTHPDGAPRWMTFGCSVGRISFALTRNLLLCILHYRYGQRDETLASQVPASPDDWTGKYATYVASEPETATEERLALAIGQQMVSVLAARIEALQPSSGEPGTNEPAADLSQLRLAGVTASAPLDGTWTLQVSVIERSRNVEGAMWFRLDESWMARLLQGLGHSRERTRAQKGSRTIPSHPFPSRLRLAIVARLLEKDVPLSTVLDLRVGDVIPVRLGAADVLVGDSRLFTARVAEHKGRLCLTAFEDVE